MPSVRCNGEPKQDVLKLGSPRCSVPKTCCDPYSRHFGRAGSSGLPEKVRRLTDPGIPRQNLKCHHQLLHRMTLQHLQCFSRCLQADKMYMIASDSSDDLSHLRGKRIEKSQNGVLFLSSFAQAECHVCGCGAELLNQRPSPYKALRTHKIIQRSRRPGCPAPTSGRRRF